MIICTHILPNELYELGLATAHLACTGFLVLSVNFTP